MYLILVILIVVTALLMVGIVLVQESKGGLSSQFADIKKHSGVRRTTDLVERTTWVLAGIMVVISIACSYVIS
jgi:preprotein translocase subunit SecG